MVLKAYEGPNPVCWYRIIRLRSISIVVWLVIKFTHAKYKNISSYMWSHYRYLYPPILFILMTARHMGSLLSWSYGSWIYSYLCNQCLLPLTLWVRIPLRRDVLDTTLCDQVCQWLATGRWFSPGTPVSSTNNTDRNDITEIVLKVAFNTIPHHVTFIHLNKIYIEIMKKFNLKILCQFWSFCFVVNRLVTVTNIFYDAYQSISISTLYCLFYNRWDQDPAVVNAFYNPNTNDIGKSEVIVSNA